MQATSLSKRKWITLILLTVAGVVLYPFKSTVVPSQRVLVTTNDKHPISNALVRQIWQDYSLERYGHEEDLPTDAHGRVTFSHSYDQGAINLEGAWPFSKYRWARGTCQFWSSHQHVSIAQKWDRGFNRNCTAAT
jgi:hypothetical protein